MAYVVQCVVASDGVPVAPCGTIGGVAYAPVVVESPDPAALDFTAGPDLYVWSLTLVITVFVVGLTVGAIMRVIRSA